MDWDMGLKHGVHFRMFEQKNVMTSLLQCFLSFGVCAVVLFFITANPYIQFFILGILGIMTLTFISMFIYFGVTQPKLLQSERHIEKMAVIEQGMVDGKNIGIIDDEEDVSFANTQKNQPKLTRVLKPEIKK